MNKERVIKEKDWRQPRKSAFEWTQDAHKLYITARLLYWKNFPFQFALLGAHAIELYLKAFLINKVGKYPNVHFLDAMYRECTKYDSFFNDESLSSSFLPEKARKEDLPELWCNYTEQLRYPESLIGKPLPTKASVYYAINSAGTCESLDCIAHFMHQAILQPPNIPGGRNVID
ncbi:MAG: HEPN domain-containing protein, partial [Calditrichota bacterium]